MKKKILGLLVALCLVIGMLPLAALAADPAQPVTFKYATGGNSPASTAATLTLNPGDTLYYVTKADVLAYGDATAYPGTYVLSTEGASVDNWTVKFEYPADGTPTVTFKDATLVACSPLIFNGPGDLNVIVEGDNTIGSSALFTWNGPVWYNGPDFALLSSPGDLNISGPGKLTVKGNTAAGTVTAAGKLTVEDVDLVFENHIGNGKSTALNGTDVTIKGGSLTVRGYFAGGEEDYPYGYYKTLINATGDLLIEDSKVSVIATILSSMADGLKPLNVTGDITISNTEMEFANCGYWSQTIFSVLPTIEFDGDFTCVASAEGGTYDPETETYTAPETAAYTEDDALTYKYVKITHACAGGTATCEDKAICEFCGEEYGELADHEPDERTDCSVDTECTVCGDVVTPAGEHTGEDDGDCTTAVKCTVCEKEITAAKEGHAYTDNSDASCNNEGCTKTRTVETPKPGTNGSPQTGDNTALVALFSLLAVSALGLASVLVFKKKVA